MRQSQLWLAVAIVLGLTAVVFVTLGVAFNFIVAFLAIPFGLGAYFLWTATTSGVRRITWRVPNAGSTADGKETSHAGPSDRADSPSVSEARAVLGVGPDADEGTIRRAYRERVKQAHPDAEEGSRAAFRRVQASYQRLAGRERR